MPEDLTKAEQRWRNRRLFRPERRSRGVWLIVVLLLLLAVGLVLNEAAAVDIVLKWWSIGD